MNPFAHLGLRGDADEREIKRAYARALKTTRPDGDPVAFQALNEAYQAALAMARTCEPAGAGVLADASFPSGQRMDAPADVLERECEPEPIPAHDPEAATARGFDLDAFCHELAERCRAGRAESLIGWLYSVPALYDIEFKHQLGVMLYEWLLHDDGAPALKSSQLQELDEFFSLDFSSRLAPLTAARWAIGSENTSRYGEPKPIAIRQLKRPFRWPRALLLGAVPGMNRRIGSLAWRMARDAGRIPAGMDPRQYHWFTRLAADHFLGRARWLSVAAAAVIWGVVIAVCTAAALTLAGETTSAAGLMVVAGVSAGGVTLLSTFAALYRWLQALMGSNERFGWLFGAGAPVGLSALAVLATVLPDPGPILAPLPGVAAVILAARHWGRMFDALRFFLAAQWCVTWALPDGVATPALALAGAATALVAGDAAFAWRNAMPFPAALGNRWVRIGSYVALAVGFALLMLALDS